MWFNRDISAAIRTSDHAIQVLRGPRQCGKTSLLLELDPSFVEVSLDDPALREVANRDPELFLRQFGDQKLFIDEAQYAPALFPSLKRRVDLYKRGAGRQQHTIVRLTGSNQILMDRSVKESLAGRASFFDLNTLSVAEIRAQKDTPIQDILFCGGWPEIHGRDLAPGPYLDNYINSYVEKDIVLAAGIQKAREFLRLVQLLAGRVGQTIDYSAMASECGIDGKTVKDWVSILERMHVVALVPPYSTNLTSRLIKSPKLYFIDTGLACRLQGWSAARPILTSPQQGPLFECLVFSELWKTNMNFRLGWRIYHWRSRDKEEVDFLIQRDPNDWLFVEAKVSRSPTPDLSTFPLVRKVFGRPPAVIVCHEEGDRIVDVHVPISKLRDCLLDPKNMLSPTR